MSLQNHKKKKRKKRNTKSERPHQSSGRGLHSLKPCSGFVIDEKWLSKEKMSEITRTHTPWSCIDFYGGWWGWWVVEAMLSEQMSNGV